MRSRFRLTWLAFSISVAAAFAAQSIRVADAADDDDFRDVIERVETSVVTVEVPGVGIGSGFVVRRDGVIATCFHVIAGAKEARVKLPSGATADVTGFLAVSPGKDIVLLKIETKATLTPLSMVVELPAKGEKVLAFGAPHGLEAAVGDGIVSAIRTGLDEAIHEAQPDYDADASWVQTTAPISAGNGGGPLVTLDGMAVGVNSWFRHEGEKLNFAISTKHVRRLLEDADGALHRLDALPAPPAVPASKAVAKAASGEATRRYWYEIGKISDALTLAAPQGQSPRIVWEYSNAMKALDIEAVDEDLVEIATLDAQNLGRMANAAASQDVEDIKHYNEVNLDINEKYDRLRIQLSAKYGITFPSIFDQGKPPKRMAAKKRGKAKAAAAKPDDIETKAAKDLAIAKKLVKNKSREAAIRRLEKLIKQFPETTAAGDAREMLKELAENDGS